MILWVSIAIVAALCIYFGKPYFAGGRCTLKTDLTNKVVIITGGCQGIGYYTALGVAERGATVIIACRNESAAEESVKKLKEASNNTQIHYMNINLSDLQSISNFAQKFKSRFNQLDILINSAGIMALKKRETTKQGFEHQVGVNQIGHFYLTQKLLDLLRKTPNSRIINMSSITHMMGSVRFDGDDFLLEKRQSPFTAYANSKLMLILFTKELARREAGKVKAVCLHPGISLTNILNNQFGHWSYQSLFQMLSPALKFFTKSASDASQTALHLALSEQDKIESGAYYMDCLIKATGKHAQVDADARRLQELTKDVIDFKIKDFKIE